MVRNRRLKPAISILLALLSFQTIGCSKSSEAPNKVVFSYELDPRPPRVGVNTFTVTLTSAAGERLVRAHVSLEGDMTHAGMSPVFGEAREIAPGRYQGTLELSMRGDWLILFHIRLASGEVLDRQVELRNIQAT